MRMKITGILGVALLCLQTNSTLWCALEAANQSTDNIHEILLTADQAEFIAAHLESLVKQALVYNKQNKAARPDSAQPCDPAYPACNIFDLSELTDCCCAIRSILCCLGTSILDVLGACTDQSVILPSVVDKSDIDALCLSVVGLIKTLILDMRGAFLNVGP